jgi:GNAT superfamily N-acetyltransferase
MRSPTIRTATQPAEADRQAIIEALVAYNDRAGGPSNYQPMAILIQDESGATVGGLWGKTVYDWLFVELFVVPESLRRQKLGSEILTQAESIARQRGCIGVWLDTYDFQARGFYERCGYELFGTIDDHPRNGRRFFLKKRLV